LHDNLITLYDHPPFSALKGLTTRLTYLIICPKHPISRLTQVTCTIITPGNNYTRENETLS